MEWLSQNWVWVLFAVGMIAMHMFGHGRHGEHGNRIRRGDKTPVPTDKGDAQRNSKPGSGHHH